MVTFSELSLDQMATHKTIDFMTGCFLKAFTYGKYLDFDSMRKLLGTSLAPFTSQETREQKVSFDFLGYNYYTTSFTINNMHPPNPPHENSIVDAQANISYDV